MEGGAGIQLPDPDRGRLSRPSLLRLLQAVFGRRRRAWNVAPLSRRQRLLPWRLAYPEYRTTSRLEWWSMLTGRPAGEIEFMLALSEQLDELSKTSRVVAIGYAWLDGWRPLVLIEFDSLRRKGVYSTPRPWQEIEWWRPEGPLAELQDLTVAATTRPIPAVGTGRAALVGAQNSNKFGTVGLRVIRRTDEGWRGGFLTAGHTFPDGVGTSVVYHAPSRLRRAWRAALKLGDVPIGRVVLHESPGDSTVPPAYDYAIVELANTRSAEWRQDDFVPDVAAAGPYEKPNRVLVFAGPSGEVEAASLFGACMNVEKLWRDCWTLGPSSALRDGDSGSTVVDWQSGEPLGTYVGRSELIDRTHHLYVQSLDRVIAERWAAEQILIERRPKRGK